ncbi:MAG: hypothetical protein ABI565_01785 [Vicinamibacteria bacterium]
MKSLGSKTRPSVPAALSRAYLSLGSRLGDILVGVTILFALLIGPVSAAMEAIRGVEWPFDIDFYRSISIAQVMADGSWLGDPFYRGERNWYPPLIPFLAVVLGHLFALEIPRALVVLGPWINLLVPLSLFTVVFRILGHVGATLSVGAYLYLQPLWIPSWVTGGYSPWPFNAQIGLAAFVARPDGPAAAGQSWGPAGAQPMPGAGIPPPPASQSR